MGSAILGLVVLDSIEKQAEQAMRDKPVSSVPPLLDAIPSQEFLS